MVELNCETDFVARNEIFRELAHNIAMQIAAQEPICISPDKMPKDTEMAPEVVCLLLQPYIKSPELTIQDLINEAIAKTGENIKVNRFARFELGQSECRIAGV
jgi:elongation factor Ts